MINSIIRKFKTFEEASRSLPPAYSYELRKILSGHTGKHFSKFGVNSYQMLYRLYRKDLLKGGAK